MRTDAPTGTTWEEGMEIRLGSAARERSPPSPVVAANRACNSVSKGRAAATEATAGGAQSPAPREGRSAGLSSTAPTPCRGCNSSARKKFSGPGVNGLRPNQGPPLGLWASKMLEREAEPTTAATDPSPAGKGLVTKGAPHQGSSKKPHQSATGPAASSGAPTRPRRRPPPQRPHRCPDCDKAFSYPSKLAAHRLTHSGARPHPCPHCPKAFGHRSKLAAHLWTHAPARPHPCPDCSKSFCYPSKLAAHRHTHHATDARPYPCPHCPKAFSFPSKLAAHRLCHDPPTAPAGQAPARHHCSSCGQAFGQRRLLLLHQRSHHPAESQGERE